MQRHFDEELKTLKTELIQMGALTETAIRHSTQALINMDAKVAKEVISRDKKIDELELVIDERAIKLLALKQPLAIDLRFITTAMKINTELERIADLAVNIAQRSIELSAMPALKELIDIPKLSEIAQKMIKGAIDSFINRNKEIATDVILMDPEANNFRDKVYNELINEYMIKDGKTAPQAVPLILVARHLERICDHAAYIAEDVIYMVDARQIKHHRKEFLEEEL